MPKKGNIPWNKGLKLGKQSPEVIEKRVKAREGYRPTEKTKENMRLAALGRVMSEETKELLRKAHLGKEVSEKTRIRMSDAQKKLYENGRFSGMKGKKHTEAAKEKIGRTWRGKKRPPFSETWKRNIGLAQIGKTRIFSSIHKERLRIAHIKCMERQFNQGLPIYPAIGNYEKEILDDLEEQFGYKIIRQHKVNGYFLDGYVPELNLAIEVDEEHHQRSKEKDLIREKEISESIGCNFFRIDVSGWSR